MSKEAMKLALEALESARICIEIDSIDLEAEQAIKALEEALAKQEQRSDSEQLGEPVAWYVSNNGEPISEPTFDSNEAKKILAGQIEGCGSVLGELYTTPQQRKPLWIDPNDKTQEQFLPHIGKPILFCHGGKTYYGHHNGGSFQYGYGVTKRYYNTWECRWMYFPAAHGIKE